MSRPGAVVLYSVADTAERLRCSRGHVYNLVGRGQLRTVDIGRGRPKTRIRSDDLAAFIDAHTSDLRVPA